MPNKKSILPQKILDRPEKIETWEQAITETELAISNSNDRIKSLEKSLSIFREQERAGLPYPGSKRSRLI
jgi:hypothetical protein